MVMASWCPPFYPLHRITVVLRHLRQSNWLTHLHRHHPHPQSRYHVDRLFRHIDQLQDYISRHRLLPTMVSHRPRPPRTSNHNQQEHVVQLHHQCVELRRIHQHQLRESLTRIRHCIRPLRQYLLFYQPDQLIRYHQSMNILDIFTTHL
ncbi:hypothetical protein VNO77_36696 [Canavalia gladiata]|uniref:Uncharacterized protein n=1 Tax=Canavalia gladiata TaxID=3824 RepID=A0AAN9K877_CANGL